MLAPMDKARSVFGNDIADVTFKKWLVYLFLLGLAVRAFYLIEHARSPSFGVLTLDQKYYDGAARMIVAGEDLHQLNGFRPLLYPMFLAVLYKIGGAHGVDLAIVTQHLLGVLTGLLVALMGRKLFGHRLSGIVGGAVYLLAPVPLYFEGELLIESSYVFLICAALLLLFRAAENKKPGAIALWVASGAAFVLIAQARPNILVFMSAFPLLAGWFWSHSRRLGALLPLWGLAGGLAMAIAWGFVNRMQLDHFEILPSAGGVNLYFGNKRTADGMVPEQERRVAYGERYQDSGEIWAREEYAAAMRKEGRVPESNPMAVSKYWTHRALEEIQAAPGSWLKLMAKKCWLLLWNAEIPNNKAFAFLQTEFTVLRVLPERWVVLLMFAPAGIWAAARFGNRTALLILLTYLFVYGGSDLLFFICDRYRYPLWPVMAGLAGGGLWTLVESLFNRRRLAWIVFSMAVMAAISLPNWFDAKLPSFARDYLFRSIAWYEKGHFPEALADCNRALELDPQEVTALHHRGNILLALRRYGDASQDYEQTLKIDRDDGGIWNNYGAALEGLGRTNDALAAYAQATQCAPPSKSAFLAIAMDQILRGQTGEASHTLDQLEKLEPKPNAIVLALRSVIAQKSGLSPRAAELEGEARHLDAAAASWAFDRVNTKK
jgi:tetratricopeptide (TPR) repeat protein